MNNQFSNRKFSFHLPLKRVILIGLIFFLTFSWVGVVSGSTSFSAIASKQDIPQNQLQSYASQDETANSLTSNLSLDYSTFLGGNSSDYGADIAVDNSGSTYITGYTSSANFPTKNAYNATFGGKFDVFLAKFNSAGELVFSTFFGGNNSDYGTGIAVDNSGFVYITGQTFSANFPTKNAINATYGGSLGDVFVAKFASTGSLVFSTFLGEGYYAPDIAIDSSGSVYITGSTSSRYFPMKNAYNATFGGYSDAFLTKLSSTGDIIFSTYFGGNRTDHGTSVAVDNSDFVYITGYTSSPDFPMKNAFNTTFGGAGYQAFIAKFTSTGSLLSSTYFGGTAESEGNDIAVDNQGSVYITGYTLSHDFPTKNAFNATFGGIHPDIYLLSMEVFLAKFNSAGNLVFSTFIGETYDNYNSGSKIALDSTGNCYVTSFTKSSYFPMKNAFNATNDANGKDFISEFNGIGGMIFSSYIGDGIYGSSPSIAVDSQGSIYLTGGTDSNFPTKNALYPTFGGMTDVFLTKFFAFPPIVSSEPVSSTVTTSSSASLFSFVFADFLLSGLAIDIIKRKKSKRIK